MNKNYKKFWIIWLIISFFVLLLTISVPLMYIGNQISNSHRRIRKPTKFCITKLGINIVLKSKYLNKIRNKHPKVNISDIKTTIREGVKLEDRRQGTEHWIFYKKIDNKVLKVPVMLQLNRGIVKSAYYVSEEDEVMAERMLIKRGGRDE